MDPKFKAGSIILPLLLALAFAGFFLVKAIVNRTFTDAQAEVELGIADRYDPYSSKYSLSKHMGEVDTWITFKNERHNYRITHPRVWNRLESRDFPGAQDLYEAALASHIKLSVTVQNSFTEPQTKNKIKTIEGDFIVFENAPEQKSAYIKKNNTYYIVRMSASDYFGSEQEFLGTFYNILKRFEFLD